MEIIGFAGALLVGLVVGLLGSGGSILAVPIMVVFFHIKPEIATVYSLFIIGITSLFGTFQNVRNKRFNPKQALLFAIPAVLSISITRLVVMPKMPAMIHIGKHLVFEKNIFIMVLFSILMMLAAIPMIRGQKERPSSKRTRPMILVILGATVGLISGIVGAGGGFLIIPALSIFMRLSIKTAIATSIMIIALNSVAGFSTEILRNEITIDWYFLSLFTGISIAGLFLGMLIGTKIQAERLKVAFGYFVLLIGVGIFFYEIFS